MNQMLQPDARHEHRGESKPAHPQYNGQDAKLLAERLAKHCAEYKGADISRSLFQLANSFLPLLALLGIMYWAHDKHYWLTLVLILPAAGLLVRLFIIQHDCGHGSFFNSAKANDFLGRALSVLTFTPYGFWRRAHALHHVTSGNLDRRGIGDIVTLTVKEYQQSTPFEKLKYRLYRNPFIMFFLGAPFHFLIFQRVPAFAPLQNRSTWRSIMALNVALILFYGAVCFFIGFKAFLMIWAPVAFLATMSGVWLFFVQHQFEDTYWAEAQDWDFEVASILGSSFYDLPKILQWFSGNIGLHHIHHLCSAIPNYRLQACLDASPELQTMNRVGIWESLKCTKLKLWDEDQNKLISFQELKLKVA